MWKTVQPPEIARGSRIAFFGPIASGKTYAANYLVRYYRFTRISLADKLKAIAYELYGIEGKDGEARALLQDLGDKLRSFDDDVFSKYTLATINTRYPKSRVVIDDLRLPREAELLKSAGFQLIGINTPIDVRQNRIDTLYPRVPQARQSHATEVAWTEIPSDALLQSVIPDDLMALDDLMAFYVTD